MRLAMQKASRGIFPMEERIHENNLLIAHPYEAKLSLVMCNRSVVEDECTLRTLIYMSEFIEGNYRTKFQGRHHRNTSCTESIGSCFARGRCDCRTRCTRLRITSSSFCFDFPLVGGTERFQRPYVALTSHAQFLSVHCAVIADGRYNLWIKDEA
jgi:hypothetical protein